MAMAIPAISLEALRLSLALLNTVLGKRVGLW